MLDPGSQQTFVTEKIINTLDLKPVRSVTMGISGFLSNKKGEMSLKDYELKITPMDGKYTNLINALGVPKIFPNTQDRNLSCVIQNHKFTKQLQLTDNILGEANVDILIGADLCWKFVTGETKRSNTCNLVAIKSIF